MMSKVRSFDGSCLLAFCCNTNSSLLVDMYEVNINLCELFNVLKSQKTDEDFMLAKKVKLWTLLRFKVDINRFLVEIW
jgi:hypothetical protein